MSRIKPALLWGMMTALLGVMVGLTPIGARLEKDLGLRLLFKLRGPRTPPPEVVVIDMDRASAAAFNLPPKLARWPRSLHGRLVDRLADLGAGVVAFDVVFEEPRDADDDQRFARAVARARNVVLCEYLQENKISLADAHGDPVGMVRVEGRLPLLPELAEAAVAVAPFPLPKVPVRLNQAWFFKSDTGDEGTLPAVAMQVYGLDVYPQLYQLIQKIDPGAVNGLPTDAGAIRDRRSAASVVRHLREIFLRRPGLASDLFNFLAQYDQESPTAHQRRLLKALIGMYGGDASVFINYYGPPQSIRTLSYHRVLAADITDGTQLAALDLAGKAVFVGVAERLRHNQEDAFYTVFSRSDGTDIGGVEIGATLFANLLETAALRPVGAGTHLLLVTVWGFVTGALCLLTPLLAAVLMGGVGVGLMWGGVTLFSGAHLWLPLATPLFVQVPAVFVCTLIWKHFKVDRERKNIRDAFGFYLPPRVVKRLAQDLSHLHTDRREVYGICLFSDAQQYTRLAETLAPDELHAVMNRYYEAVFAPVKKYGGTVSDVVGDSVLVLWAAAESRNAIKTQACRAALEILSAVERFKVNADTEGLPTRIGIHAGNIVMGNVGAGDHFEYRPVGDIVNTASRLEGLNKHLGTRLIVSEEICHGEDSLLTRPLGTFLLAGKTRPVTVRELVAPDGPMEDRHKAIFTFFARGLAAAQACDWQTAMDSFRKVLELDRSDGPAKFYLNLCRQYGKRSLAHTWNGVVTLESK